jgi:hypothetical protein
MALSEEARERLADIVELQPTKNATLQDQWGLDSGSEVHQYLESALGEYYYRNADSLICATPQAEALLGDGVETGTLRVAGEKLDRAVVAALPDPDERPRSVVATLHAVRESGRDPGVDAVRSSLHRLVERGVAERVEQTVPTFRLTHERDQIEIAVETDSSTTSEADTSGSDSDSASNTDRQDTGGTTATQATGAEQTREKSDELEGSDTITQLIDDYEQMDDGSGGES